MKSVIKSVLCCMLLLLSSYEIFNFYPYSQSNNHLLVSLDFMDLFFYIYSLIECEVDGNIRLWHTEQRFFFFLIFFKIFNFNDLCRLVFVLLYKIIFQSSFRVYVVILLI